MKASANAAKSATWNFRLSRRWHIFETRLSVIFFVRLPFVARVAALRRCLISGLVSLVLVVLGRLLLFGHGIGSRRQRLQVRCNVLAVLRRELRHVLLHRRHRAADHVEIRRVTGLEQIDNFLVAPAADAVIARGDIRDSALAFRILRAGKGRGLVDAADQIALRVTLGTMTGPLDQVGAAIDFRTLLRIRRERLTVNIEKLPGAEAPSDIEWER